MTRRRATIVLHWATFTLLVLLMAGGGAALGWAFVAAGLAFAATAALGLHGGPGPKLEGLARAAFPGMHWGMYALTAGVAAATAYDLLGGSVDLALWHMALLSAAALHGVFHLWRHTALGDGALRKITPRALHGLL
ncbi:MAG: hypothetical protein AAGF60_11035 [Pseudomonadota bacterium]